MDVNAVLAQYDREMRIDIEYPDMLRETLPGRGDLPGLVRFLRPLPGNSFILYTHLQAEAIDRVIQEQAQDFNRLGLRYSWDVYEHDQPPDLGKRLEAAGFEETDEPGTVMALDLSEAPSALLEPVSHDVRSITTREQLEDVIRIESQVWDGDFKWITERMGSHLEIPGYLSIYAAYVDNEPACAGWTYYHPNSAFGALFGGSTVSRFRGRGLYTAVLAARVQEARQRGRRYLVIDASSMSRPIVARYGFQVLTTSHSYVFKGGVQPHTPA